MPYLAVGALFALFACNNMLTRGMFMDGLIYTSIADNLSRGAGSFWHLTYTPTSDAGFYSHPPLMMAMLSVWFRLFGGGMLSAKMYSVAVVLLTMALMVAVWRRMGFSRGSGWLPLLMWTLVPDVALAAHNNYLESTMLLFVLGAVWCVLRGGGVGWCFSGGALLALAFLTKGPTGLFPLALPLLLWVSGVRRGVGRALSGTVAMLAGTVLPLAVLWLASPGAADFFGEYFRRQLLPGVSRPAAEGRAYIVGAFFGRTAVVLASTAIVVGLHCLRTKGRGRIALPNWRAAGIMAALALCGTLPMMAGAKQRAFYLLTVFPFVALAAAALLEPIVMRYAHGTCDRKAACATGVLLVAAVALNAMHFGKPGRDKALIGDMDLIAPLLDEGERVTVPPQLAGLYSLQGYYWLERHVALDKRELHRHLLTTKSIGLPAAAEGHAWREVSLPIAEYLLYERCGQPSPAARTVSMQ